MHQLKVAAVVAYVSGLQNNINTEEVVQAALLHDMGAIVKFNLVQPLPDLNGVLSDAELSKWREVQREFREKYGLREHAATSAILREIGVSENVMRYFNGMGFFRAIEIRDGECLEIQVLEYGDLRVSPRGIVSMEERLVDGRARYAPVASYFDNEDEFQERFQAMRDVERELFAHSAVRPEDITDTLLTSKAEALRSKVVPTAVPAL